VWEIDWYKNEWPWPLFKGRLKSGEPLLQIRHWIFRKPLEIEPCVQGPLIGNGLWRIKWSHDRWRHVAQKGQVITPKMLRVQYRDNSAGDAIQQQSLITRQSVVMEYGRLSVIVFQFQLQLTWITLIYKLINNLLLMLLLVSIQNGREIWKSVSMSTWRWWIVLQSVNSRLRVWSQITSALQVVYLLFWVCIGGSVNPWNSSFALDVMRCSYISYS